MGSEVWHAKVLGVRCGVWLVATPQRPHTAHLNIGANVRGVKYIDDSHVAPHTWETSKIGRFGVWGVGVRCVFRGDAIRDA